MTNTEFLRQNILMNCGYKEDGEKVPSLESLRKTEWSPEFERLMRNRMVIGALRYGRLHGQGKPQYDRITSAIKRLEKYKETGNIENLVDTANMCLLEFEEGIHPKKHFNAVDDGEHTEVK